MTIERPECATCGKQRNMGDSNWSVLRSPGRKNVYWCDEHAPE